MLLRSIAETVYVVVSLIGKHPRILMIQHRTVDGNAKNGITRSEAFRHVAQTVENFRSHSPMDQVDVDIGSLVTRSTATGDSGMSLRLRFPRSFDTFRLIRFSIRTSFRAKEGLGDNRNLRIPKSPT